MGSAVPDEGGVPSEGEAPMTTALILYIAAHVGVCALAGGLAAGVYWLGERVKQSIRRRMWRKHWEGHE